MFGRQNDVIAQDQKRDADVSLRDDAMAALVKPPSAGSQTDSPQPAKSAPDPVQAKPSTPPPSVDSFSPIPSSGSAMSPFDLVQKPTPAPMFIPGSGSDNASSSAQTNDAPADDEGTLLGGDETALTDHLDDDNDVPSVVEPETEVAESDETDEADDAPADAEPENKSEDGDTLLSIKQEALSQLSPLVGQLKLGAEEKFRTIMMLIQASDNKDLIPEAYDTALKIQDEQVRAQALLDIVNEINYFTNKKDS